jgi:hypothetical protein
MAKINTERRVVEAFRDQNLTIKWSPERPLATEEREKLVGAVRLAARVAELMINLLGGLALSDRRSPYATNDVRLEILRYHFKLPPLDRAGAAWKIWRPDMVTIREGYQKILAGIKGPLVISDAYSKELKSATIRAELAVTRAQRTLLELQLAEAKLFGMGATAGHQLVQQVRQSIAQVEPASKLNPRELAEDKANNVGGFVKSRQNPAGGPQLSNDEWERHLRHDDPEAPYLLPQQKGAIHLNFKVFLADSQQHKLQWRAR